MRKLILFIGLLFCTATAHAAEMVNVEYIHKLIARDWGIEIPYNPALTNPKVAANMKYLLTAVDVANRMLNGRKTTDYGDGEYATMAAADTIATNDAVARLIKKEIETTFFVTTAPDTSSFSFKISAMGNFLIDWGDGETQVFERTNVAAETYSHTYDTADEYTIGIGGTATWYHAANWGLAAISFNGNKKLVAVRGSLGSVFPTIDDGNRNGRQPMFCGTFQDTGLTDIPGDLFDGVTGHASYAMFSGTFKNCTGLTKIPAKLFSNITSPNTSIFESTFYNTGLTEIPDELFSTVSGSASAYMFRNTFQNCTKLKTVPEKLFGEITNPSMYMFASTFQNTGLTEIPADLFSTVSGPVAADIFNGTFANCNNLTEIPAGLFRTFAGPPAIDMFRGTFSTCSSLTEVPAGLFYTITGPAAISMFQSTFERCTKLTKIPTGLFSGIYGAVQSRMFLRTFMGCRALESIPENLFGVLSGPAASEMFYWTFYDCGSLSGDSAKINGQYLYEIWPDATGEEVGGCYFAVPNLSDGADIPDAWK